MKLHEFQAKDMMRRYGIRTPRGEVASTPDEAGEIAARLGCAVAVKAQVHVGGRGKAGGIAVAATPDETRRQASRILGMSIKGLTVTRVLVEEAVNATREYYAGMTVDRARRSIVVMASSEGGVDIEDVAARTPERIAKVWVSPRDGFEPWQARSLALSAGFERKALGQAGAMIANLFRLFIREDASLAEINPLMLADDGRVIAADAKITVDDNSLSRHPEYQALTGGDSDDPLEQEAYRRGLTYVKLDGNIGVIGNGAGLVMATLDAINAEGGRAADFLDIGGGARADVVKNALELILMDGRVRAILINVFGGITRCDEVASGLLAAAESVGVRVPIVVRLAGTRAEEGRELLRGTSVVAAEGMADAARHVVALAARGVS
ncbi:MAG: ADP-forming succinate--CoA ligase subunit beta [Firmicutes bacterium]|nr:ADP-forming succinate--CoA ligase subunit beta [Bacillota bacterium]MDH7494502.1 ADP-forming succinate--CoA ligase subunit beta [Bacillota bacterium]